MRKAGYETNTWPQRHSLPLAKLKQALVAHGKKDITIRLVGPGGIAADYRDRLPSGDEETFSGSFEEIFHASDVLGNIQRKFRRVGQQVVNSSESRERNKLTTPLTCSEPKEVYELLEKEIGISSFRVEDKYARVLEGVSRLNIPNTRLIEVDLQNTEYQPEKADVVIAMRVLHYCTENPGAAYRNLVNSVNDGGFLLMTVPEGILVPEGCTQLWPGIEEKVRKPERRLYWKGQRERVPWKSAPPGS